MESNRHPPAPPHQRLTLGLKLGYGIGDVGSNIFIVTSGLFLLFFLTNTVGVSPGPAGLVLLFPKLWDVVTDPVMGAISDATHSRWGRRRPYLLLSAVPFGLSFFFLFVAPDHSSELANAIHVGLLFALGCTVFTMFNVPYSSMVPELTDDYNERTSVTSFRMVGSSVGVLLAGALAMPLVELGGKGATGFRFMGAVLAGLITLFSLACFWGTRYARTLPPATKSPPFGEQVKIALRNRPFAILVGMYVFQSLAMGVLMAGLVYYVKYVMDLPETAMGVIFPIFLVTGIAFIPVWVKVSARLGKIRAYRIGLLMLAGVLFSFFFTTASLLPLFYAQVFLLGVGFASFQLFPFSMMPDTVEYDELQSGLRREGIFSGVWSSAQKTAYSVGPSIVGFALAQAGFLTEGAQPPTVALGIRIVFCLFTSAMLALSLLFLTRYDLTEARFETIKQAISDRIATER